MKFSKLVITALICLISSCSFFNNKTVDLAINSEPEGAGIFIDGKSYGRTPAVINIAPKDYVLILTKEGYGSTQVQLTTWGTIRRDVHGNRTSDGTRCLLDSLTVIFSFNSWSSRCTDFKQKQYNINIPKIGEIKADNDPMIGIGNHPENIVEYYYTQDVLNGGAAGEKPAPGQYFTPSEIEQIRAQFQGTGEYMGLHPGMTP